jgi:hypothetical protein
MRTPAPDVNVPRPNHPADAPDPLTPAGNVTWASGLHELLVIVHPLAERTTATRAYVLYAPTVISLVVWSPVVPGSAVCKLAKMLATSVTPETSDVFFAMVAKAVMLNISSSKLFA